MTLFARCQAGDQRHPAAGTEIFYDDALLRRLGARSTQLIRLSAQMRIAAKASAYTLAEVLLDQFARTRQEQVLERSVRLYAYARGRLRDDEVGSKKLLVMRRALARHTREAGDFVRRYLDWGIGPHNAGHFCAEFERFNLAVRKHERYDTLYFVPLYKSLRK